MNRQCEIILVVQDDDGGKKATVAPITHSSPIDPDVVIEIPQKVKVHLGLDSERSWISTKPLIYAEFVDTSLTGIENIPVFRSRLY